ncbi:MAG: hypothetical protein ACI80F_000173 [Natronomonas sp.]|jgi:hypothetical protein
MTKEKPQIGRRRYISGAVSVVISAFAGCNDSRRTAEDTSGDSNKSATPNSDEPKGVEKARRRIKLVYRQLDRFPIVEGGEFSFDIQRFDEEFDREQMLTQTEAAERILRGSDSSTKTSDEITRLLAATRLAEYRIKQRILIYRTIVAGMTYRNLLRESEYETATKAIRDGRRFLEQLQTVGKQAESELQTLGRAEIVGYDRESIHQTQKILIEVTQWTSSAYRGFHDIVRGFGRLQLANPEIEAGNFKQAGRYYAEANEFFADAEAALDRTHGYNQKLERLAQLVTEFRCMLPTLQEGCDDLQTMFETVDPESEEIPEGTRETLIEMRNRIDEC